MLKTSFSQNAGSIFAYRRRSGHHREEKRGRVPHPFRDPLLPGGPLGPADRSWRRPGPGGGRVSRLCGCGPLRRRLHGRRRHPHLRQVRAYHRPPGEPGRPMAGAPRPPAEDRPAPRQLRRRPPRLQPGGQDDKLPGSADKGRRPRGGHNRRPALRLPAGAADRGNPCPVYPEAAGGPLVGNVGDPRSRPSRRIASRPGSPPRGGAGILPPATDPHADKNRTDRGWGRPFDPRPAVRSGAASCGLSLPSSLPGSPPSSSFPACSPSPLPR